MKEIIEKASKADLDTVVKKIMSNEIGTVLLEADIRSIYDILAEKSTFKDRLGIYGNGMHITFHLYPLLYTRKANIEQDLINSRMNAVQNIFDRWTAAGYNKHAAKSPFASKKFNEYLNKTGFTKADYMLLLVE